MLQVGTAENIQEETGSVDLITACESFHWFNKDLFYKEVKRLLKYNGVLALFGYGMRRLRFADAKVDDLYQEMNNHITDSNFFNQDIQSITHNFFEDIDLPLNCVTKSEKFTSESMISGRDLLSLFMTTSTYQQMKANNVDEVNKLMMTFEERLIEYCGPNVMDNKEIKMLVDYFALMGRNCDQP